jgi:hypothetical protein
MNMMAKKTKRINHRAKRDSKEARLALMGNDQWWKWQEKSEYEHRSFEQFVQTISPLNQLERNCHQEKFLELSGQIPLSSTTDNNCGEQTATRYDNVKDIPTVCLETHETQSDKSDGDVN